MEERILLCAEQMFMDWNQPSYVALLFPDER